VYTGFKEDLEKPGDVCDRRVKGRWLCCQCRPDQNFDEGKRLKCQDFCALVTIDTAEESSIHFYETQAEGEGDMFNLIMTSFDSDAASSLCNAETLILVRSLVSNALC
jgi:hypothetical protein